MRTKTAYEITNENGKTKVAKVGLAPVQRDGVEYEFTVVMDLSVDGHVGTASKDRTGLFDGQHIVPSEETGKALKSWLDGDAPTAQPVPPETKAPAFKNAAGSFILDRLYKILQDLDLIDRLGDYSKYVCNRYGADNIESLVKEHVIEQLNLLQQCKGKPDHLKKLINILNQQQEAA
jgi:hypothetical protein